jgi:hypothetical protein
MAKTRTKKWNPPEYLKRNADVVAYFEEALAEGDAALVAAALGDIARARGAAKVSGGRRSFKATIAARARRDPRFCEALLTEAINEYRAGHTVESRTILRDLTMGETRFWEFIEARRRSSRAVPLAEVRRRLGLARPKRRRRGAKR